MFCKNCFKKISSRSRYCKYCGAPVENRKEQNKQVTQSQQPESPGQPAAPPPKKKEYSFKLRSEREKEFPVSPKVMGIGIAVILAICVMAVLVKSSIFQTPDSMDYNEYIGVWQENPSEDVTMVGGVKLEISSINGSTMMLSMGFYDGGGAYNGIEAKDVGAVIKDGSAYYSFSNDGYGNSGNGVLTFNGRDIKWKSILNKDEPRYYDVVKITNDVAGSGEETKATKETKPAEETSEKKTDGDYVLPDSSGRFLKKKELKGLTSEELRIARNEIMARHGRKFNDPALAAYFESKTWYKGTVDPEVFDSQNVSELNKYELKNIALIQSME